MWISGARPPSCERIYPLRIIRMLDITRNACKNCLETGILEGRSCISLHLDIPQERHYEPAMSCSDKTHKVHEWPTSPGSTFAIQDCERSCCYCSLDKSPGLRRIYTTSRPLRNHVEKVHLDSGQYPGVTLLPEKPNPPTRRSSKGVSATQMLRRSDNLPPQQKLESLADLLCLPPEYRKEFQRMVLGHFARRQTVEDEAVSDMIEGFLTNHGPALWPANSKYREHLQASQQEDFWSPKWKNTTISGPVSALDARLTHSEKSWWRKTRDGRNPSEREDVLGSRLGLVMARYVRSALELRDTNKPELLSDHEIIKLRDAITAKHLRSPEPEPPSRRESRDSSPEVPLRLAATKQGQAISPDSSPELPLMTLHRPQLSVIIPSAGGEEEQAAELPVARTLSAADCLDVLQELGHVSDDDFGYQKDGPQEVDRSTTASRPESGADNMMEIDTAESINAAASAPPRELSLRPTSAIATTTTEHARRLSRVGSDQQTGPEDFFQQVSDALIAHLRSESSAEDAPSPRTVEHATSLRESQQNMPSSLQPTAPDANYPSVFDLAPGSTTDGIPWLLPPASASSVPVPSGHRRSESRPRGSVSNFDVAHNAQALDASASNLNLNLNAAEEAHLEQRVRQDNGARKRRPRSTGFRNAPLSEGDPTPTLFRPGFGNFGEPVELPQSQQINAATTSASLDGENIASGFDAATSNVHPAFDAPLPHPMSIADELLRVPSAPSPTNKTLIGLPTPTRIPPAALPSNSTPSPTAPSPMSTGFGMLIPENHSSTSPTSNRKRRRVPSAGGMGVCEPGSQHAPRSSLSREYVPHQGQEDTVGLDGLTNAERERVAGYMRDTGGLGGLPLL